MEVHALSPIVTQIEKCEVCNNSNLVPILNLGKHPMCDDLIRIDDKKKCIEYPIEILYCGECITAHQKFQIPKKELFPFDYHYRARFTKDVLDGMQDLVNSCEKVTGPLKDKKILDIGCNDGSLLNYFHDQKAMTIGIEPTSAIKDANHNRHTLYNDFFSLESARHIYATHGTLDLITFTNVFAHIEDLKSVLDALKVLIGPKTVIVVENHYLGAVLENNQFDTFYHEHPRTYSYSSFKKIAETLNLPLLEVQFPSRYGGNIRVFMGNSSYGQNEISNLSAIEAVEKSFFEKFKTLQTKIESWRTTQKEFIKNQVSHHGKLKAKAFPGRAAILLKLLDLNEDLISAVYEKPGSLKIGHYVPGTKIPILSDEVLFEQPDKNQPILNLAWHISREINSYLQNHGYLGRIIDVLNPTDFVTGH